MLRSGTLNIGILVAASTSELIATIEDGPTIPFKPTAIGLNLNGASTDGIEWFMIAGEVPDNLSLGDTLAFTASTMTLAIRSQLTRPNGQIYDKTCAIKGRSYKQVILPDELGKQIVAIAAKEFLR